MKKGELEGIIRKILGDDLITIYKDNNVQASLIQDWNVLWQASYDLNRYGSICTNEKEKKFEKNTINRTEASKTAQIFANYLTSILDNYYHYIIQLESKLRLPLDHPDWEEINLQGIFVYIQSVIKKHKFLAEIVRGLYIPLSESTEPTLSFRKTIRQGSDILNFIYSQYLLISGYTFLHFLLS